MQPTIRPLYLHLVKAWEQGQRLNQLTDRLSEAEKHCYPQQAEMIAACGRTMMQCLDQLPSGWGFDSGVTITPVWHGTEEATITCLFIEAPYRPMDEHGFYEEWIVCRFRVEPRFDGIYLVETKHDGAYDDHVEYITETLYEALTGQHLFPSA